MEYLYRYLRFRRVDEKLEDWENKRLERIFTHNELYFSSPTHFNDPFDCKMDFTFEDSDDNDYRKWFEGKIKNDAPNLSEGEIKQKVDDLLKEGFHKTDEWRMYHRKMFSQLFEEEAALLGVLCLSEKPDDILMWSHYADGHTGFCLEFDKAGLKEFWGFCEPVEYRNLYLNFKEVVDAAISRKVHRFLLSKSEHWQYEKEWRVIVNCENPANRFQTFPDHLLKGIILGCQMPEENKVLIHSWMQNRKIFPQLYQTCKKENEYGLRIEKC